MAEINVLSDMSLNGSLIMTKDNADFPANPAIGTLVLKEQNLYAYINVGGLSTWYPFSSKTRSYIHTQGLASLTWTINHQLNSSDIWYQIQDDNGNIIMPSNVTIVDANTITVGFSMVVTGTVLIVAPDSIDVPVVKATVFEIGDGDVIIDSSGIRVNGSYVGGISQAIFNAEITARNAGDSTLQNNINAEITARTEADDTLQSFIDAEVLARLAADATLQANIDAEVSARLAAEASLPVTPYDLATFISGKPANGATIIRMISNRSFLIPAGLTETKASAGVAASASTVFSLRKNGTQFGTITFAASSGTGTMAAASNTTFAVDDILTLVNQATADATLADISITISAVLV